MGWFTKSKVEKKKPKIREDLWIKCPKCNKHIFKEDWHNSHSVCSNCNFHAKLTAYERIGIILDPGTFKELNETIYPADPLEFVDGQEKQQALMSQLLPGQEKLMIGQLSLE